MAIPAGTRISSPITFTIFSFAFHGDSSRHPDKQSDYLYHFQLRLSWRFQHPREKLSYT